MRTMAILITLFISLACVEQLSAQNDADIVILPKISSSDELKANQVEIQNQLLERVKNLREVKSSYIEEIGSSYWLISTGVTNQGKAISIASSLVDKGDHFDFARFGTTHTCQPQEGCTGCTFARDDNGEIIGCDCSNDNVGDTGTCKHTVVESDG